MGRRGGKRQPPARTGPSGPGKFARRDERSQPVREVDLDRPDIEYGQRSMLADAQKIAPVPKPGAPRSAPAAPGTGQGVTGVPGSGAGLPPWLVNMPSNRPSEPVTAGLDAGPGPGSEALQFQAPPLDVREVYLEGLYAQYHDPAALAMLEQLRNQRFAERYTPPAPAMPEMSRMGPGPAAAAPVGEAPTPGQEPILPEGA